MKKCADEFVGGNDAMIMGGNKNRKGGLSLAVLIKCSFALIVCVLVCACMSAFMFGFMCGYVRLCLVFLYLYFWGSIYVCAF